MAVIDTPGTLFVRLMDNPRNSSFINGFGEHAKGIYESLEAILRNDSSRTPVYEGDTVTLQF